MCKKLFKVGRFISSLMSRAIVSGWKSCCVFKVKAGRERPETADRTRLNTSQQTGHGWPETAGRTRSERQIHRSTVAGADGTDGTRPNFSMTSSTVESADGADSTRQHTWHSVCGLCPVFFSLSSFPSSDKKPNDIGVLVMASSSWRQTYGFLTKPIS